MFYQYCDNENAPYNDKMFVFLVTVEKCTEGSEVKQIEEVKIQITDYNKPIPPPLMGSVDAANNWFKFKHF